jgi:hypothetical protein
MKTVRVWYKITTSQDVEIEDNQTVDDAISIAGEIITQGYQYSMDDWKYCDAVFLGGAVDENKLNKFGLI